MMLLLVRSGSATPSMILKTATLLDTTLIITISRPPEQGCKLPFLGRPASILLLAGRNFQQWKHKIRVLIAKRPCLPLHPPGMVLVYFCAFISVLCCEFPRCTAIYNRNIKQFVFSARYRVRNNRFVFLFVLEHRACRILRFIDIVHVVAEASLYFKTLVNQGRFVRLSSEYSSISLCYERRWHVHNDGWSNIEQTLTFYSAILSREHIRQLVASSKFDTSWQKLRHLWDLVRSVLSCGLVLLLQRS